MSRNSLVNQLIIILFNLIWFMNSSNLSSNLTSDHHEDKINNQSNIKRSDNVILDGIQYLPDCGLLCRLHKFTNHLPHLPPVMINFNHQYQHFIPPPVAQIDPISIAHSELHPEIDELHNAELFHTQLHHPDLHHPDLHHPDLHHPEFLHHADLHDSDLHMHSKLLPLEHNFGLHPFHRHIDGLGLGSTNFQQMIPVQNSDQFIKTDSIVSTNQMSIADQPATNQPKTSASNLVNSNIEDAKLEAVQRMFENYESKNPVSIVEENFPLPANYNALGATSIETHPSSVRPLFMPEKSQLSQSIPPYELEDSKTNFIDYQPFHPPSSHFHPPSSHFYQPVPSFNHRPPPYFEKITHNIFSKKPNIEILKLNDQDHDYPLPPPNKQSNEMKTHYDNLIEDAHGHIKDPTTYYQHPEPQRGSITYADADFDKKPVTSKVLIGRPETSKIDENSVLTIGQNYAKVKHIQEQFNSMKRQYPENHQPPVIYDNQNKFDKFEDYHHMNHFTSDQHHMPNSDFDHHDHYENHYNFENHHFDRLPPSHILPQDHYRPPVIIEDSPPMHIQHQSPPIQMQHLQSPIMNPPNLYPIPDHRQPKPMINNRPNSMQFNGFYSNYYASLPPAKPPTLTPFKK